MNPIRYTRYKTEAEKRTGRLQDTGARREEYEQEQRQKHRRIVIGSLGYLGYTQLVETPEGAMYEACIKLETFGHMSLGTHDTAEDAAGAILEWDD